MTSSISDPGSLEPAWNQQYGRISQHFASFLPKRGVVVEIGCGKGQLTVPLARRMPHLHIMGVDNFRRPYSGGNKVLSTALAERGVKTRVEIVVGDYQIWLRQQPDLKYEAIFSSEFLPELDTKGMRNFLVDCHRVVKPGGKTIHSFLSSTPRNPRQRRLIEADSNPRWTKTPPAEWFSPSTKKVVEDLKIAGFKRSNIQRIRSGLVIRSAAARKLLGEWDISQAYWKSNRMVLEKEGLEVPDWVIISAVKPS